jgi:pantoate--beta-alanine ligase
MRIINSTAEMQRLANAARLAGERIALVPTMGYLHEGHVSLMREARRRATMVAVSIFVNPTQFGPNEDLASYPRDFERDCELMRTVPVDVVFAPQPNDVYGPGFQSVVEVTELTKGLCGAHRPGHFCGVTTVVAKLFNIVKPHLALFGQKDYQQLRAIQQMTRDLNFDIEIVPMKTVRESDGLAMSSRNAYLSPAERKTALALSRTLKAASASFESGAVEPDAVLKSALTELKRETGLQIEYVELLDAETLQPPQNLDSPVVVAIAARVGKTRLIDNVVLTRKSSSRLSTSKPSENRPQESHL